MMEAPTWTEEGMVLTTEVIQVPDWKAATEPEMFCVTGKFNTCTEEFPVFRVPCIEPVMTQGLVP